MRPSSHTTIDATVSLPWIVEMSKQSMRRGSFGNRNAACKIRARRSSRSSLVEALSIAECGVAMRELHHPLLGAALGDDDADLAAGVLRQPVFEHLLLRGPPARESPAADRDPRRTAESPLR